MLAVAGATSCLAACALPPDAQDLTDDQRAILAEVVGEQGDAEIEFLEQILPNAIPLVDSAGNSIADNTKLLQVFSDAQLGLKDFLAGNRIKTLSVDDQWEIGRGVNDSVVAAAHGTETATDADNYILIITGDDDELYLHSFGDMVHEWFHFAYGGHSNEVTAAVSDGVRYDLDISTFLEAGDAPYIGSAVCEIAEDVLPNFGYSLYIGGYIESEMARIDYEIELAIARDVNAPAEEVKQQIVKNEYNRLQKNLTLTQTEWAAEQANAIYWPELLLAIGITDTEYQTALENSPKLFEYSRKAYAEELEALLEAYRECFEDVEMAQVEPLLPATIELPRKRLR